MGDYDILFGVVIRLPDETGDGLLDDIESISEKLGGLIEKEYSDFMVLPFGMELVEEDKKVRILNKIEYPVEYEGDEGVDDDVL